MGTKLGWTKTGWFQLWQISAFASRWGKRINNPWTIMGRGNHFTSVEEVDAYLASHTPIDVMKKQMKYARDSCAPLPKTHKIFCIFWYLSKAIPSPNPWQSNQSKNFISYVFFTWISQINWFLIFFDIRGMFGPQ